MPDILKKIRDEKFDISTVTTDDLTEGSTNLYNKLPTGAITMWGTTTAPTSWLICDGSAVSRTTYSALFAVIGTSFGVGDGSTTFNIPNFKSKFPIGLNASDSSIDTIGETGGVTTHTHTVSVSMGGSLTSGSTIPTTGGVLSPIVSGGGGGGTTGQSPTALRPPYITINFIIKT